MDFVKSFTGGEGDNLKQRTEDSSEQKSGGGGFLGGIGDKLNAAAGGGPESEKNETVVGKGGSRRYKSHDNMVCSDMVQV